MSITNLKLNTKIVLLCAGLVFSITLIVQASTWIVSNRFYQQQLHQEIQNAKSVLQRFLDEREQSLFRSTSVLTADFGFIGAVATSDADTINSALSNHGSRINADLMILLDKSKKPIALADANPVNLQLNEQDYQALIDSEGRGQFYIENSLIFQLIALPIKAPHTIGYALVGFQINGNDLETLHELTGLELSVFSGDRHLLSSTSEMEGFHPFQFDENGLRVAASESFFSRPKFLTEYVQLTNLTPEPIYVLLSNSMRPFYKQYDQISLINIVLSLLVAFVAVLLSMRFAKGLTGQLAKLTEMAQAFAKGDYLKDIHNLKGGVEVDKLTSAFIQMGREVKHREDEVRFQARHDGLTGLYNIYTFRQELALAINTGQPMIVVAVDITNHRQINDRLGIDIADECLKETAKRLLDMTPSDACLVGRIDGNQFVIAAIKNQTSSPIEQVHCLMNTLRNTYLIDNISMNLIFASGFSSFPEDGNDAETLLRRAHIALDNAIHGHLSIHAYESGEDEALLERLSMIEALKTVLADNKHNELHMVYQPKISLGNTASFKVEALIRWQSREKGFVRPDIFVSLAEQSSLIIELTQWVILNVLDQLVIWAQKNMYIEAAINVSAQDLLHADFRTFIKQSCLDKNIDPSQVTIEITERDIMEDEAKGVEALDALKQEGFKIAIDDYGIGQSSLSKLKDLNVDQIKLDQAFIRHLDTSEKDRLITHSTIDLAHALGFELVAEGVENETSMSLLQGMGCDFIQGYYVCRPISPSDIDKWYEQYVEDPTFFKTATH